MEKKLRDVIEQWVDSWSDYRMSEEVNELISTLTSSFDIKEKTDNVDKQKRIGSS